jgi:cell division protein FtsW (lipid II flippase)
MSHARRFLGAARGDLVAWVKGLPACLLFLAVMILLMAAASTATVFLCAGIGWMICLVTGHPYTDEWIFVGMGVLLAMFFMTPFFIHYRRLWLETAREESTDGMSKV